MEEVNKVVAQAAPWEFIFYKDYTGVVEMHFRHPEEDYIAKVEFTKVYNEKAIRLILMGGSIKDRLARELDNFRRARDLRRALEKSVKPFDPSYQIGF